jgi:4-diphosphocytidyl-2-C-methyl-D-erythritol kinase
MNEPALRVFAAAKVNLGLEVLRRRPDGYHEIETLFQTIDLGDNLDFYFTQEKTGLKLSIKGASPRPGTPNLIATAYELLANSFPGKAKGMKVVLEKCIPIGGGLGGGSSDAAATLRALDRLWGLELDEERLAGFGLKLGSDVPFFLQGGTAIGRGRGERLIPILPLSQGAFLLVNPGFEISSAWAYEQLKIGLTGNPYRINVEQVKAYLSRFPAPSMVIKNRLEDVVYPAYPVFDQIAQALEREGAVHGVLSGSGATVVGTFPDRESAERAREGMDGAWQCWVAEPVPFGIRIG